MIHFFISTPILIAVIVILAVGGGLFILEWSGVNIFRTDTARTVQDDNGFSEDRTDSNNDISSEKPLNGGNGNTTAEPVDKKEDIIWDKDIQYLLFQLFSYSPDPDGSGKTQPFVKADIEKTIDEILGKLDDLKGDGKTRQLGFAVGPLALDHSDEELRKTIRESFETAEKKNIAVAIHIDDAMFWINRKDLWQDKNNIEWVDWNGTIHPKRYVGWAPAKLAPHMCYTSPALRKEITRVGRDVIGAEIKKGIDALKTKNKEHLFAGVIVGWETHLLDPSYIHPMDATANKLGIVRKEIGYCALSNRGFSQTNPPKDFHAELEKIVQEWAEFWTKQIFDAGIQKERIYTHFAFISEKYISDAERANIANAIGVSKETLSFSRITGHATPGGAFNKYSRPGFSLYPGTTVDSAGTEVTFSTIYEEFKKYDNPRWALSEGTNTAVGSGGTGLSWESYLGGFFNHGASLVNIFAWQVPIDLGSPYGKVTKSADAIAAYKKFLKGEKLEESSFVINLSFQDKIRDMQTKLRVWLKSGGDLSKVESLLQKMEGNMKEQKTKEAEKVLDDILELIGEK